MVKKKEETKAVKEAGLGEEESVKKQERPTAVKEAGLGSKENLKLEISKPKTKEELKAERDKRAQEKRAEQKRFEAVKAKAYEFEKRNRSKIVVFRSRKGWWKMGGNSALIYVYRLAPRMDIKPKLRVDTDFFSKFHDGVVSIKDVDALERNLKTLNVHLEKRSPEMVIFSLGYKIEDSQMELIRKTEENRREQVNRIVAPKIAIPIVNVKLHDVVRLTYIKMKKSPVTDRDYITMEVAKLAKIALGDFVMMCNGVIPEKEALQRIIRSLETILVRIDVIMAMNIWESSTCLEIATDIQEIRKILRKEFERF